MKFRDQKKWMLLSLLTLSFTSCVVRRTVVVAPERPVQPVVVRPRAVRVVPVRVVVARPATVVVTPIAVVR